MVASLLVACPQPAPAASGVTVFAAASLREAFEAAGAAFTAATGAPVSFQFGGSDTLATQLLSGARADVFACANAVQMKRVADASLLAQPAKIFVRNRLVVIVSRKASIAVASAPDLAKPGLRVVLAAKTVPVGAYARTAFATFGTATASAIEANVVSEEVDVKAVASKIALGEGDAGVVYATDVTPSIAPAVQVIEFARGVAPDANYPIARLSIATNSRGGQDFIDFLQSKAGLAFLSARGFSLP